MIAIFRVLHNDPENGISLLKGHILHHTYEFLRDILASQEYDNKGISVLEKAKDILIEMIEGYPRLERSRIERIIKELVCLYEKEGGDGEFLRKMDLRPSLLYLGEEIPNGWLLEIIEMIFRRIYTSKIHQQQENNLQSEIDARLKKIHAQLKKIHDLWSGISRNEDDEQSSSTDWLACYCPKTGTILMRIEYIIETYESLYEGEPIVYTILPASSDPDKNFKEITVGNHKFYVAKNIWTEERFALFKKRAEEMIKKNHKLPKLWDWPAS